MITVKPLRGFRKFYGRFSIITLVAVSFLVVHWIIPINHSKIQIWTEALSNFAERKGRYPVAEYPLEAQQLAEGVGLAEHDVITVAPVETTDQDGHAPVDDGSVGSITVAESFEPVHEVEEDHAPNQEGQDQEAANIGDDRRGDDRDSDESKPSSDAPVETPSQPAEDWREETISADRIEEHYEHHEDDPEEQQVVEHSPVPCDQLQGAQDVTLIIKTGSTEAMEKLPVHFRKTLQCYPHSLIFSDFGEQLEGHQIVGTLDNIIDEIRLENDDFDLWRRLQAGGRAALDESELSTHDPGDPTGGGGNFGNGGWRLDKFKNIPMVRKSLAMKPDAKWYVFTDADTYIVWSNLLKWLEKFDHTQPLYIGSGAMIDDQIFAHGGSGYVLSHAAAQSVSDLYGNDQAEWDWYAANHWAGDCVLSSALKKLGVELTWGYPLTQGGDPVMMDLSEVGYDKRIWCYPAVTYHHLTPQTIEDLWYVEQNWTTETAEPMRHGDVFKQYIIPQMKETRRDWDNLAGNVVEEAEVGDIDGCRLVCVGNGNCVQYAYEDGKCKTSDKPQLGSKSATGVVSGWMYERIERLAHHLDQCDEGGWIGTGQEFYNVG